MFPRNGRKWKVVLHSKQVFVDFNMSVYVVQPFGDLLCWIVRFASISGAANDDSLAPPSFVGNHHSFSLRASLKD